MAHLFSPLRIRGLKLENRIVMPPLASSKATERGMVTEKLLEHYHAFKGMGTIIVEHCYVQQEGRLSPNQLGICCDQQLEGLKELAGVIKNNGIRAGIQLSHAGSVARKKVTGTSPRGPSAIKVPRREGELPEELTESEIKELVISFTAAASRATAAGFDFVELHGAHGFLINQFLSPLTNQREDGYGGHLRENLNFPLQVVRSLRQEIPEEMPLFFRLGADDLIEGGLKPEDGRQIAEILMENGVDLIDLSGGLGGYLKTEKEGFFLYLADEIKPSLRVPVLVTGGIRSYDYADKIVRQEKTDLVGVGRELLKNPDWALEARKHLH